jgi:hypothetical protein
MLASRLNQKTQECDGNAPKSARVMSYPAKGLTADPQSDNGAEKQAQSFQQNFQ